ncbi:peptide chain release factor N(5)-glutamine methyltransferase [Psychroflexus sp. YR1-1]|uniref:peptide chain release factor N(5)-glutamine methyltransferase n=1 Tax=Psychroflexus aurantiacus TaxID=2709310 RepID=A0A6B3QZD3_9FLAO|nr:peptide chain release factor N(5)-glutamine methyltransferase [Psychroflexus aurantiacus]NEV93098.1 peptide chain release factor N(5)-glutamine methyltransferase [Psychroflexus aurantiacus]
MTNLKMLKKEFLEDLSSVYDRDEAATFFSWLAEDLFGLKTHDLLLNAEADLDETQLLKFEEARERLKNEEPIQYILGYVEFLGLKLKVSSDVLIPRPETEELVQWILDDYQFSRLQLNLIDLGTGSGCIPIALAKHLHQAKIKAFDISAAALQLGASNLLRSLGEEGLKTKGSSIEFIQADILELERLPEADLVVSNPPYVKRDEQVQMKANVLKNEPHLALFVENEDPLIFYRKIAELTSQMTKTPVVYLEINQYLAQETCRLFEDFGFQHIELRKDFRGNDRMLKAY